MHELARQIGSRESGELRCPRPATPEVSTAQASPSPERESVRSSLESRETEHVKGGVDPPRTHSRYHGRLLSVARLQPIDGKPLILNCTVLDRNSLSCGECHLVQVVYNRCLVAPSGSHRWIC